MTKAKNIPIDTPATDQIEEGQSPPAQANGSETKIEPTQPEAPEAPAGDIDRQLAEAQEMAAQNYDKMLRMAAELDNLKKRAVRDLDDMRKFANEIVFKDLLDVLDNLQRALDAANAPDATLDALSQGVGLTLAQLEKIFDKHNVKPIVAVGQPFDPRFHQAMMQEASGQHPANTVTKELQRGFTIHDRLLRAAMVVVSAPPAG